MEKKRPLFYGSVKSFFWPPKYIERSSISIQPGKNFLDISGFQNFNRFGWNMRVVKSSNLRRRRRSIIISKFSTNAGWSDFANKLWRFSESSTNLIHEPVPKSFTNTTKIPQKLVFKWRRIEAEHIIQQVSNCASLAPQRLLDYRNKTKKEKRKKKLGTFLPLKLPL